MEKARNVDIRQFYREDLGVHSEELLDKLEAVSQDRKSTRLNSSHP